MFVCVAFLTVFPALNTGGPGPTLDKLLTFSDPQQNGGTVPSS